MAVLVLALLLVVSAEYVGPTGYWQGSESWTGLCAEGGLQSPLPLTSPQVILQTERAFKQLRMDYAVDTVQSHIEGAHFVVYGDFGTLTSVGADTVEDYVGTVDRVLVKAPAEHQIEGRTFDLEVQVYHRLQGADSSQVALSVLYQVSEEDSSDFLDSLIASVATPTEIDLAKAFEGMLELYHYFSYLGSETTPPCQQFVQWVVWAEVRPISRAQLGFFSRLWQGNPNFAGGHGNNRGQQEAKGREVLRYEGVLSDLNAAGTLALAVLLLS